jgi:penicillin-binding protein 1C
MLSILDTPFPAIFKTGTSNQFNNIWALGATEKLCIGIWMGNFTGETVIGRPGSSIPAAAAVAVLTKAQGFDRYKVEAGGSNYLPDGIGRVRVCSLSGMAAGPYCPGSFEEYFRRGHEPEQCDFHTPAGTVLPAEYRDWIAMKGHSLQIEGQTELTIEQPAEGALFYLDETIPAESQQLRVSVQGRGYGELYLDGRLIASGNLPLTAWLPLLRGEHQLSARSSGREVVRFYRVR